MCQDAHRVKARKQAEKGLAMPGKPMSIRTVRCACGSVEYEAIGAPITSAICYCASCQANLSWQQSVI
jgi:hypothetical protein